MSARPLWRRASTAAPFFASCESTVFGPSETFPIPSRTFVVTPAFRLQVAKICVQGFIGPHYVTLMHHPHHTKAQFSRVPALAFLMLKAFPARPMLRQN